MTEAEERSQRSAWLSKLSLGLKQSSQPLTNSLSQLLGKQKIDKHTLQGFEEALIASDLGVSTTTKIISNLESNQLNDAIDAAAIQQSIADKISNILKPIAKPLSLDPSNTPHVILVCGVNGSGKTTTIGKLANTLICSGNSVLLAAGDTFRAAATEQLTIWADRVGCSVISGEQGSDAAGIIFDSLQKAKIDGTDALLIDTAGRLQNKTDLMEQLKKIVRVIKKIDETAPHTCLLVLDATVGQNAHSQVRIFSEMVNVTGLILTKLDGTAKGGVLVALAETHGLPVHAIGLGEGLDDLRDFDADDFAKSLLGIKV